MLLQLEIFLFLSSFFYILYYLGDKAYWFYIKKKFEAAEKNEKKLQRAKLREEQTQQLIKIEAEKDSIPKTKASKKLLKKIENKDEQNENEKEKNHISAEQGEELREIWKRAQIHISRWYFESARTLIIEWLSMKKEDKELNLLLADVYEREKKYQNAAYIYKDLLEIYGEEMYTLQRLWNVYVLLDNTAEAIEVYEKAQNKDKSNTEVLDILAHLYAETWDFKKALKYSGAFLKEKPRNAEKLSIKAYALEKLWKTTEAIKCYELVLQVQPYNSEIQDRIKALHLQLESQNNQKLEEIQESMEIKQWEESSEKL